MTKIDDRTKEVAVNSNRHVAEEAKKPTTSISASTTKFFVMTIPITPSTKGIDGGRARGQTAGNVRFIGFTGNKDPRIHLQRLDVAKKHGFHFDTVQMPINIMDAHFRSFARRVVPRALKERIGVFGMKSFGDGIILKGRAVEPMDCLHYSLHMPISVLIAGIDKGKYWTRHSRQ